MRPCRIWTTTPFAVLALAISSAAMDVTLKLEDVTVAEAVQRLADATGYDLNVQGDNTRVVSRTSEGKRIMRSRMGRFQGSQAGKRISVDWQQMPFWEAVEQLCDAGDCRCTGWSSGGLRFYPGRPPQCPIYISGPCRFEVTGIHRIVSFHEGLDADPTLSVSMQAMWEPGWRVLGFGSQPDVTVADMEDGTSLVPLAANRSTSRVSTSRVYGYGGHNRTQHHFSIKLKVPPEAGGLLADLQGTLTFTVAGREDEAVFDNILSAKDAVAKAGEVEVRVKSVENSKHNCVVTTTVTRPDVRDHAGRRDYTRGTFALLDDAGNALHCGSRRGHGKDNTMDYTLTFFTTGGRTPARLVFKWPSERSEKQVEFRFENLPLP